MGLSQVFTWRYFAIESRASENVQVRSLSATASLCKFKWDIRKSNLQPSDTREIDHVGLEVDFRLLLCILALRLHIDEKNLVIRVIGVIPCANKRNTRIQLGVAYLGR